MPLVQRFDRTLLFATVLQTFAGLAIMSSASWLLAAERYGRPGGYFFTWQAATALVGLGSMVAAMHVRLELLAHRRTAWLLLAGCVALLVGALFQAPVNNVHRWLGFGALSVQPSVIARLGIIVVVAVELPRARAAGWGLRPLLTLGAAAGATALLIVIEPDLGSAVLLVAVVAAMAFAAGLPLRLLAMPSAVALVGGVVAIVSSPYRLARVRAFLDPEAAAAASWQTRQSLIALGSGGVLGKGYGAGLQKLFFLPEPHTDFVFAITGEELGLVGALGLMLLIAVIVWRGLAIAERQAKPERALLAFGITAAFAIQCLIHIAVCTGMAPPKGIPLPLVSYGKTDLVVSLASLGLLLNLSREVPR